ncbi:MAG: alpha/beta hydrolase [Chitinophagaceae bacterium]
MQNNPKNILFITGCFVGNNCWDEWQTYFQNKGYSTSAPPWPHKIGSPAQQRLLHPDKNPGLTRLTLSDLVDHFEHIAKSFDEKPIAIGHSMGGLITQILVNRGAVAAGVAIHSVQPAGIFPYEFPLFKLGWKFLGIFSSLRKTYLMTFKDWQYAFTNGMSLEEQQRAYGQFVIPESKRVNLGGLGSAAKIDFKRAHAPLLITSGTTDNIIPAHLNWRNSKKYKQRNDSIVTYKEFPGRTHFVLGQQTWQEDAAFIVDWLSNQFNDVSLLFQQEMSGGFNKVTA